MGSFEDAPITWLIIITTVLTSIIAWRRPHQLERWMHNPYMVDQRKQYGRLISSGFIHANYLHLIFNMLALYFFGPVVEFLFEQLIPFGKFTYLGMYLLGIVISDLPSFFKHRHNPGYNSLGASGAVSAVVFSGILFNPNAKICLYFAICLPGLLMGSLYLIYSYFQGGRMGGRVNHDAHFYGALWGVVFTIIAYPPVVRIFLEALQDFEIF